MWKTFLLMTPLSAKMNLDASELITNDRNIDNEDDIAEECTIRN